MLRRGAAPGADHRADHQRRLRLAAEHVAELGGLVEDLVEADAEEIAEHQFGDRPQAGDRGAGGGAHDRRFGDRRVDDPRLAELAEQPLGDAEHAAIGVALALAAGAAGDILADHDDARVAAHLLGAAPRSAPGGSISAASPSPSRGFPRAGRSRHVNPMQASCPAIFGAKSASRLLGSSGGASGQPPSEPEP